jgi:hypothetical protein
MKWNAFVLLRLRKLKAFLYYGMVKPLPFMLGKVPGEPGDTPNLMGKGETIP